MYPLFVGNVTVTFPFVHVFGVYVAPLAVGTVPVVTFIVVDCAVLPDASYTTAYALYVLFCVNPVTVCVLVVFVVVAVYVSVALV